MQERGEHTVLSIGSESLQSEVYRLASGGSLEEDYVVLCVVNV